MPQDNPSLPPFVKLTYFDLCNIKELCEEFAEGELTTEQEATYQKVVKLIELKRAHHEMLQAQKAAAAEYEQKKRGTFYVSPSTEGY